MDKKMNNIISILEGVEEITIYTPFKKNEAGFIGGIELKYREEFFKFMTIIPLEYPLSKNPLLSISFIPESQQLKDCNHVEYGAPVCIHPKSDYNVSRKLISEISLLKEWIDNYFFEKREDTRLTYLLLPKEKYTPSNLLFTDVDFTFKKYDFGFLNFLPTSIPEKAGYHNGMILSFSKLSSTESIDYNTETIIYSKWSSNYKKMNPSYIKKGLWVFIDKEPLNPNLKSRKIVLDWKELGSYFTPEVLRFLLIQLTSKNLDKQLKTKYFEGFYYLFLGYKIQGSIHWQLIKIPVNSLPIKKKKGISPTSRFCISQPILWSTTTNCSYDRFFGRAKLTDKITTKKILIIGIGALGSTLATLLTRGGIRDIGFYDFDAVQMGNICRSSYSFSQLPLLKTNALYQNLVNISPFIQFMNLEFHFPKNWKEDTTNIKANLDQYDLIFDCSTDMEVLYILDQLQLSNAKIYSFSISNEAKELVCIKGPNLVNKTASNFSKLPVPELLFYEGTGCHYPTFKATYTDINALLNSAISFMNNRLNKNKPLGSFIVKNQIDDDEMPKIIIDEL